MYIQLTISFLFGRKPSVNFRNQRLRRHLTADYTRIISRTLKVTDNHIMYDCGVWFLGVIRSSSGTLLLLADLYIFTRLEINDEFHLLLRPFFFVRYIIKQLLDSVLVISRTIKVLVRVISRLTLQPRLITPISTLIILDITITSSNNCL